MKPFSILLVLSLMLVASCAQERIDIPKVARVQPLPVSKNKNIIAAPSTKEHRFRKRNPIPLRSTQYEGSLWKDESSWGNLLRDHRARFKNDLVNIMNLGNIINVSEETPEPVAAVAPQGQAADGAADTKPKVTKKRTSLKDEELNQVLRSLKSISARVTSVLPNGHLVVKGEKIDYRRQNQVRYVTVVRGIIRPEDITEENEIDALKLTRAEVKTTAQLSIKRLKQRQVVAPKREVSFLDRLGHLGSDIASPEGGTGGGGTTTTGGDGATATP